MSKRYAITDSHEGFDFEWNLVLKPLNTKPAPLVTCTECHGSTRYTRDYLEETDPCWKCHGSGKIPDPTFVWNPQPPEDLVAALRKVWMDHWNKQQNDKFELTPSD